MGERAPDILVGDDGDVVFIRRDIAGTVTAARAYALEHEGQNLSGLEVNEVELLPVPKHFTFTDYSWGTVRPGTPGAVAFWRFRV